MADGGALEGGAASGPTLASWTELPQLTSKNTNHGNDSALIPGP